MKNLDFDWLTDEFMLYCRSTQLREKTMSSYEQTLHLFGRWCADELKIYTVDKITENVIRKYIDDLQTRGKYTFYVNDLSKKKNYPDRRRDYRNPVSVTTINNYIRNIRVFFNWLEREYIIRKNPMKRIRQLKHNRQAKVFLSDEDLKKLLSKFDKPSTFNNNPRAWVSSVCFRSRFHTIRDLYFCPFDLPPVFLAFDSSICGSLLFESSFSNSIAYQKEREKVIIPKFY